MNGVEFLFALSAVIGMTTLHFLWIGLAYKIENGDKKQKKSKVRDIPKSEMIDDAIDYDGMGNQGRFVVKNERKI